MSGVHMEAAVFPWQTPFLRREQFKIGKINSTLHLCLDLLLRLPRTAHYSYLINTRGRPLLAVLSSSHTHPSFQTTQHWIFKTDMFHTVNILDFHCRYQNPGRNNFQSHLFIAIFLLFMSAHDNVKKRNYTRISLPY